MIKNIHIETKYNVGDEVYYQQYHRNGGYIRKEKIVNIIVEYSAKDDSYNISYKLSNEEYSIWDENKIYSKDTTLSEIVENN